MVCLCFTCTNGFALVINFVDSPNTVLTHNSVCVNMHKHLNN